MLNNITKNQEVITSKNFEVTLFACDFSKSILKSTINMKVLPRRANLFEHSKIIAKIINQHMERDVFLVITDDL